LSISLSPLLKEIHSLFKLAPQDFTVRKGQEKVGIEKGGGKGEPHIYQVKRCSENSSFSPPNTLVPRTVSGEWEGVQ
jgi:hypothetical protein